MRVHHKFDFASDEWEQFTKQVLSILWFTLISNPSTYKFLGVYGKW